jgi:hypothetical protein
VMTSISLYRDLVETYPWFLSYVRRKMYTILIRNVFNALKIQNLSILPNIRMKGAGRKAKRMVLQCINGVGSNPVEGRTKI